MVKNKVGGNRHKKMARKNVKADARKPKLRLAKDKCEIYAKVTKMFGNGMCEVICQDEVTRLLIIRRKFRGRNRRDNMVTLDNVVLVGIREWEVVRPPPWKTTESGFTVYIQSITNRRLSQK